MRPCEERDYLYAFCRGQVSKAQLKTLKGGKLHRAWMAASHGRYSDALSRLLPMADTTVPPPTPYDLGAPLPEQT